jgi:orotate phosphoribosyltransferase-like protein
MPVAKDLKLSHQEIATELNTSREVISRLLKKNGTTRISKLHRNHIELNLKSDLCDNCYCLRNK